MPRAIVAVDCETEDRDADGIGKRRIRVLLRWHAVATLLDRGRPGLQRESTGTDIDSWWTSLEWLLKRGGVTWVVSCPAGKAWALLGVWGRIEDGTLHISGSDNRSRGVSGNKVSDVRPGVFDAGEGSGIGASGEVPVVRLERSGAGGHLEGSTRPDSTSHPAGYLVLEDPPNVLHARVAGTTGTIHWVDSRNYGVTIDDPEHTVRYRARELHEFATGMVRVLLDRSLGGLKDTAGSQAMASFRRKHLGSVVVCHTNVDALAHEAAGIYGGRCECFRLGPVEGPVYHYDFRSLYPAIMASHLLPVRLRCFTERPDDLLAGYLGDLLACVADVTLETDEPAYPRRDGGLVTWPVGRFRSVLSGPELADAYDRGRITAWHRLAVYESERALRSYAIECDTIRTEAEQAGDRHLASWAKRLGVSLPGKFGQREKRWQMVSCPPPFNWYDEWHRLEDGQRPERWRTIAGVTQVEVVGDWANDAVPSISGYITSAARMRLLAAIRCCLSANCCYVDTDSLFVNKVGSDLLINAGWVRPGEMGYLKLDDVYDGIEVRGIKDYSVDGRHVTAGLPKGGRDAITASDAYWWQPWIGLATRTHQRPTADVVLREYHRLQPYRHGTVTAGGRVVPLRAWE